MNQDNDKKKLQGKKIEATLPKTYQTPTIESEDLLAFAASCNGLQNNGSKASLGPPKFCLSNRLNS